jgi:hypothetical protein
MRESRTSGSGRGDQGNPVPYRHRELVAALAARVWRFGHVRCPSKPLPLRGRARDTLIWWAAAEIKPDFIIGRRPRYQAEGKKGCEHAFQLSSWSKGVGTAMNNRRTLRLY